MIIIAILTFINNLEHWIITSLLNVSVPTLNNLTTWVTGLSIPQSVLDIYSLVICFLPMPTIRVLIAFTFSLILIKIIFGLVHFFSFGLVFGE